MKKPKKIDIHAHVTPYKQYAMPNRATGCSMVDSGELLGFYDRLNIEKGILLPTCSAAGLYEVRTNGEIKSVVDRHPDRFHWFCYVDPQTGANDPKEDLSYFLEFYKRLGAIGVGELSSQLPLDDPLVDNLFSHCEACSLPVTIHLAPISAKYGYYGLQDDLGLPRLEKMLKKHKDLKILGHSQLFWAEISADVTEESRTGYPAGKVREGRIAELLRDYPNLYCDCSATSGANAFQRDPEYAARFLEEFSDRVLYGCDICAVCNTFPFSFDAFLDRMVAEGMIREEVYYRLVRGNAERLFDI